MITFKQFLNEARTFKIAELSAEARKEILRWMNSYGKRGYKMNSDIERQLMSVEGARSPAAITVYRGMYFSELEIKKKPEAQRVLKAVQNKDTKVTLNFDTQSSWTSKESVAKRFADAYTYHEDGILGVIVSMDVKPSDVIVEMDRVVNNTHESEVVIRAGSYKTKITNVVEGEHYIMHVGRVNRAMYNAELNDAKDGIFQVGQVFNKHHGNYVLTVTKVSGAEVSYTLDHRDEITLKRLHDIETSPASKLAALLSDMSAPYGAFKLSHNSNWKISK